MGGVGDLELRDHGGAYGGQLPDGVETPRSDRGRQFAVAGGPERGEPPRVLIGERAAQLRLALDNPQGTGADAQQEGNGWPTTGHRCGCQWSPHGDFRFDNLMVDEPGLVAVVDWELAHLGNPLQDLAWLCVRSWRFGAPLTVAWLGTRDELIRAYEKAGGDVVDVAALHWWEVFCTLNWGVMCLEQSRAHLAGSV